MYCDFMERFATFGRVVTFDKRGTGLSDPAPGAAELDERMDDIRAVMDATGMEHAAVIGISEGGSWPCCSPPPIPERTDAVVVCGSFGFVPPGSELMALFERGMKEWGTGRMSVELSPGLRRSSALSPPLDRVHRASLGKSTDEPLARRLLLDLDVRSILPSVQAPMLAVHRRDEAIPLAYGRELADGVPGGRLVRSRATTTCRGLRTPLSMWTRSKSS